MLKKKLFGLFGKKEKEEETVQEDVPETPVISNDQISSLENLSEEPDSTESPEDIISKLAQINSIIGQEEPEEKDELEDLFNEGGGADEFEAEEEVGDEYNAGAPSVDTLSVAAGTVLQCFPQEMLIDSLDGLIAKNNTNSDFAFYFDRTDLLYGLSVGKLEFTIGELVNKLPMNVFRDQIVTIHSSKIELPIGEILPLVPVDWFVNREQDRSREKMVEEMEDLFPSAPPSAPPEEELPEAEEQEGAPRAPKPMAESVVAEPQESRARDAIIEEESLEPSGYPSQAEEEKESTPPLDSFPQEVIGVSKLQRPTAPRNEEVVAKPVVPSLDDVKFTPAKSSGQHKADKVATTSEEDFAPTARSDDERTVVIERAEVTPPPERPSVASPEKLKKPEPKPTVDANELREVAREVFAADDQGSIGDVVREPPAEIDVRGPTPADVEIEWKSQAPNGIDINRGGIEELVLLSGVGEHLARVIIDHRKTNGPFSRLSELLEIPGLGKHTYRSMTRLSPKVDLRTAELRVNEMFDIKSETVSLGKIAAASLDILKLDAMFFSSIDGLVLTKSVTNDEYAKLADSLSAVAPQLYKRSKKALQQGQLPAAEMISFYFNKRSVTFSGSDQLFAAYIHSTNYPHQKQLRQCKKLTSELVWYCSYRAVLS